MKVILFLAFVLVISVISVVLLHNYVTSSDQSKKRESKKEGSSISSKKPDPSIIPKKQDKTTENVPTAKKEGDNISDKTNDSSSSEEDGENNSTKEPDVGNKEQVIPNIVTDLNKADGLSIPDAHNVEDESKGEENNDTSLRIEAATTEPVSPEVKEINHQEHVEKVESSFVNAETGTDEESKSYTTPCPEKDKTSEVVQEPLESSASVVTETTTGKDLPLVLEGSQTQKEVLDKNEEESCKDAEGVGGSLESTQNDNVMSTGETEDSVEKNLSDNINKESNIAKKGSEEGRISRICERCKKAAVENGRYVVGGAITATCVLAYCSHNFLI